MTCSRTSSLGFLIKAPFILAFLFIIDRMTPGGWWVQWAALGIGIAWFSCLFRVMRTVVMLGGLAGLAAYFSGRRSF